MLMWIVVDEDKRVICSATGDCSLPNGTQITIPDGWNPEYQNYWTLVDGVLVYNEVNE